MFCAVKLRPHSRALARSALLRRVTAAGGTPAQRWHLAGTRHGRLRTLVHRDGWHCSCPDYIYRGMTCKHLRAMMQEERDLAQYGATWDVRSEQARAAQHARQRLPAAPGGPRDGRMAPTSICHIPPENVTSKVTKATLFVTRIEIHHAFPHGFHHDISGHFGVGLSKAAHGLLPGSDISMSVGAPPARPGISHTPGCRG